MNGIIVIDKPQGMTSHDVVSFIRRKTGVKRVGHTGTLDPMATGVLPVFIGKATRVIEYTGQAGDPNAKIYRCKMKLGIQTDTLDIWGKPRETSDLRPKPDAIEHVLKSFEGQGTQIPPMYSAVKVGGRKLYEYARKGVEIDESLIKERNIYIKHIYVLSIDEDASEVCFDIHCSKGLYVRTLCADAGRLLGCGAVMSGLIRLKSDGFTIENAIRPDTLRGEDAPMPPLLPMDVPLLWLPRADTDADGARLFTQGRHIPPKLIFIANKPPETESEPEPEDMPIRVYGPEGFVGIGKTLSHGWISPEKVLAEK